LRSLCRCIQLLLLYNFMIFIKKQNFALGLDIADTGLRAAKSRLQRDNIKLQALSQLSLENDIIQNEEIKKPAELIKKITELLSKPKFGSFNTNEVVAKLPASMTYIKYITAEDSPNNLSNIISNEIEKHIPLTKKDMYYDYQLIKKQNNLNFVLVGAAPRTVVDQYVAILKAAKLEISALEINSVCDCRALILNEKKQSDKPKIYALIDVGGRSSSLTIYAENTIILSISMPISSQEATKQIAKTLEIKYEQAEKAKIFCGLDKTQANGIVFDILSKMVGNLISKINSAFEYLSTHYPEYSQIDEIFLYGDGANIKNLENLISKKLNIPTRVASPLVHFKEEEEKIISTITKQKNNNGINPLPGFASAIGLSLRDLFIKQK
jgi:type IV pilus assembly protein PilM